MAQMTECLTLESPNGCLFDNFQRFSARRLAIAVKKGHQPPQHPFFTACDGLLSVHEQVSAATARCLHSLAVALLAYGRGELAERKRRRQLQSYDDLLLNLEQALHDRQGDALAAALRQRYPVALIDEFQDTDPVQYRIFQRVYHGSSTAVFLVGDPKQAIYSFRGADIFAYFRACHDADQRYTLDINWRSEPRLIQAVNALFAHARLPFLFEDLTFAPVKPASEPCEALLEQGQCVSPLRLWWLEAHSAGQVLTKGMAGELAARVTATEIVRLLQGGARGHIRIGDQPLEGGDIAVLVRSHHQAR
jgi:exodeoxyribonuclease V beta subunit